MKERRSYGFHLSLGALFFILALVIWGSERGAITVWAVLFGALYFLNSLIHLVWRARLGRDQYREYVYPHAYSGYRQLELNALSGTLLLFTLPGFVLVMFADRFIDNDDPAAQ